MTVVPRHSQVLEAVSERQPMYLLEAVVNLLRRMVASLAVVEAGVELEHEPRVVDVGP